MTEGESQLLAVRLEASLAKFEKQLSRAYGVAKKMSTGMEQRFSDMERKTQKSASASANVIQRELDKRRKGYENLMASMDPVFAATQRFQQGEKKLADALKYGEITTKEHARAMKLLNAQYDAVKTSAMQTGTAVKRAGMPMRGFGGMAQQIGYQVGDFAVQVGNGTSAVTAFAQQGSQLLGVLGPWGAVGGAALAILAPLTASILDLGDSSKETGKAVKTFADAMDVAESAMADVDSVTTLITDLEALAQAYGDVNDEILDMVRAQAMVADDKAIQKATNALQKFFSENPLLDSLKEALEGREAVIADLRREASALQDQISAGINVQPNKAQLAEMLDDIQKTIDLKDIELDFGIPADAAGRVFEQLRAAQEAAAASDIAPLREAITGLRRELQKTSNGEVADLSRALAEPESMLRRAETTTKRLNDAIGETGIAASATSLGFSDLVEKYDRDTMRLKELAAEREQILRAKDVSISEGNNEGYRQAQRMLQAIDEEIDRLDDSTERVAAMQEQVSKLQELLGYLRIDESGELADDLDLMRRQLEGAETLGKQLDRVSLNALEGQFDRVIGAAERLLRKVGLIKEDLDDLKLPDASNFEAEYVSRSVSGAGGGDAELVRSVLQVSERLGIAAKDLLTAMSYETGGTLDPWQAGPTTQWGQHRGLIQWGEPQRARYGVTANSSITEQVEAAGRYLQDSGVKAGDGLLRIYAAINAGHADKIHASDENNGGAPGTVLDKVSAQMGDHRARADGLLRAYAGVSEEFRQAMSEEQMAEREREREAERVVKLRKRELDLRRSLVEAAQQQLTDTEFEASLIGKSASEQARLRAQYMLTQDAKRRGIDLNERLAGQEKTYAELIREQADAIGRVVAAKEEQKAQNERLAQQEQQLADLGQSIKDNLLDAIIAGEDFADVLANVAKMLARAALEAALFGSGPFGGGGGGLLGGIFSSIFGLKDGGPVQRLASGGYVAGPGGPRADLVPAMLSNGEYVINAEATKKHRPLLDALNFGMAQKYASGGLVGGGAPSVTMGSSSDINLSVEVHTQSDQPKEVGRETADAVRGVIISVFNQQLGQSIRPGGVLDGRFQRKAGV